MLSSSSSLIVWHRPLRYGDCHRAAADCDFDCCRTTQTHSQVSDATPALQVRRETQLEILKWLFDGLTGQTLSSQWALSRLQSWKGRHRSTMLRHWGLFLLAHKSNNWTWTHSNTGTTIFTRTLVRGHHMKYVAFCLEMYFHFLKNVVFFFFLWMENVRDTIEDLTLISTVGRMVARIRARRAPQRGCQFGTCQVHILANTLYQISQRRGKDASPGANDPKGFGR